MLENNLPQIIKVISKLRGKIKKKIPSPLMLSLVAEYTRQSTSSVVCFAENSESDVSPEACIIHIAL